MKLFYSPGACSLSPHILLREAGLSFTPVRVDLKTHKTEDGADFYAISAKGYVPALQLDDGSMLTEGVAIDLWIADQAPAAGLAPRDGMDRYRMIELLTFIATELHKNMGGLFVPGLPDATRAMITQRLTARLGLIEQQLTGRTWLTGEQFTVADAYLFTVAGWAKWVKFDLSPWPQLGAYLARVAARPAVQAALKAEGLIK
ncbi:MAG: glutathione transferase GstA [Betaproteobacteria bacterium]|jgi:glutathione S-transferase